MTADYMQWVRDGARITAGYASGGGARATGRVIAYTERPTITIVTDDGEHITWIADLCQPVEDVPEVRYTVNNNETGMGVVLPAVAGVLETARAICEVSPQYTITREVFDGTEWKKGADQ